MDRMVLVFMMDEFLQIMIQTDRLNDDDDQKI